MKTNEIKNEIKKWEEKIKRKDSKYKTKKFIYDFQQYHTITSFENNIHTGKINIDEAEMDQNNLLKNGKEFSEKSKARTKDGKDKKRNTFENVNAFYEGPELILNAFKSGIFPTKAIKGKGCLATQLKI